MEKKMIKPSLEGIFLALILISSTIVASSPITYAAEGIDANSIAFEETTIIEFENTGDAPINTFRMWLGSDFNFKSFKTERGWIGEKTPQGVIVFSSDEFVMPGESVKFGVKTDQEKPGINWKALDKNDKQLAIGKSLAQDLSNPKEQKQSTEEKTSESGVKAESQFRIIPGEPNVGSSIRVTGDDFAPIQEFDLYLDDEKIDSFVTNDAGHFMTTTKIPKDAKAERVEFIVKDKKGNEKTVSLRLGDIQNRIPDSENIKLTIKGIQPVIHRGDELQISGTAQPKSTVTATIINPEGKEITTKSAEVNAKGNWELENPLIVSLKDPLGKYTAKISDGKGKPLVRTYEVKTDKVIILSPIELKYEIGQIMKFNGTAIPNEPLEVVIEDPIDQEVFSDVIDVGDSGFVEIELQTTNDFEEGTYTLFASQGENLELVYTGLGELPQVPVHVEFSQLNYKKTEDAQMIIRGEPSQTISLLIVDPSDNPVGGTIQIQIGPDGRAKHTIDLDKFSSGVYTAVASKGTARSSTTFTVGLQTGSGDININTTKTEYQTGDQILVLGETNPNVLITLTMFDVDGEEIKKRESFSNKNGKITNNSFRIPSEAKPGTWSIRATSGSNFDVAKFEVTAVNEEGIIVFVEKGNNVAGIGDSITIRIIGAAQTVETEIISPEGKIVQKLKGNASGDGELQIPWIVPNDLEPGTYTVKVKDAFDTAETTFQLE